MDYLAVRAQHSPDCTNQERKPCRKCQLGLWLATKVFWEEPWPIGAKTMGAVSVNCTIEVTEMVEEWWDSTHAEGCLNALSPAPKQERR